MKAGWVKSKLEDVCELVNGRAYKKDELLTEGKYRVLRVGNFFTNDHWYFSDLELEEKKYCDKGDLLYAWSASFGPRIWSGEKVIFHYHIWKVLPNPNLIDQKFLFHFFMWDMEQIKEDQGAGTTMLHVSKGSMDDRDVLLPPIHEQQRIVAILDQAFEGIAKARANAEKNLQNARALFESRLQSVFTQRCEGWGEKTLSEACEIKPPKSEVKKLLNDSDLVSFTPMEDLGIKKKYLLPNKQRALRDVAGSYTYFAENDVLLAKITPCFENGKLGIAKNLTNGIGFGSSEYIVFRPNKELTNEFLYYFLSRERFFEEGAQRMTGAVGHKRVSKDFIEGYKIAFPSIELQTEIVGKLDTLREETQRLEALYQRKIACLDELKKSLLQKAFAGEL